jgi:alanyl-tRNA synthetase
LAHENGFEVDTKGFDGLSKSIRKSRAPGAEQRFKGGLADTGEATAKLHTVTQPAARRAAQVLGSEVRRKAAT